VRILRITLHNLASLAGTHTVDFTRDPLHSAGLFSITGVTGAGKSTLLDALCLALYDATPRLQQVGRLADLPNGEKQNDPRNMLRRGTGDGFAEVAFVGVDGQTYTSRWSVRRSRRQSSGTLQHVDMVLFQGHIAAGGEGPLVSGGKKTLVLAQIEQKVGLTFEQFTRAVLLAQNEFATFLKAEDRQRAEILQALTATEHFEEISKKVYQRCADEEASLKSLNASLAGNPPLSETERTQANAAFADAERQLAAVNLKLAAINQSVQWFERQRTLLEEKTKADETLAQSVQARVIGDLRRRELAVTEEICRDARPLRDAEIRAAQSVAETAAAAGLARTKYDLQLDLVKEARRLHAQAVESHGKLCTEHQAMQPLLAKARQMDARLGTLQARVKAATEALNTAATALASATGKRDSVESLRNAALQEKQTLQHQLVLHRDYIPVVNEAARWLERLDAAIAAMQQVKSALDAEKTLREKLTDVEARQETAKTSGARLRQQLEHAEEELAAAIANERQFDTEQMAAERKRLETNQRIFLKLQQQLQELQTLHAQAVHSTTTLERLNTEQSSDIASLRELQSDSLPEALRALDVGRQQLQFIQAAVDDHAKRLRLTLQEDRECPVCGSTTHPFSQHAPDLEVTAVMAARESVGELERACQEKKTRETQLQTTINSRDLQLRELQSEQETIRKQITDFAFESDDNPEVKRILGLGRAERLSATTQRRIAVDEELNTIAKLEQLARDASRKSSTCREARDLAHRAVSEFTARISELSTELQVSQANVTNAAVEVRKASQQLDDCQGRLADLWSGLPSAKKHFEDNPLAFQETFQRSTLECGHIQNQLTEIERRIETADAEIRPLKEVVVSTERTLAACEAESRNATADYQEQFVARQQLFDGRAVDIVEEDIQQRLVVAQQEKETAATAKDNTEAQFIRAEADRDFRVRAEQAAQRELATATAARERWLDAFNARTARALSLEELDLILSRDDVWIQAERAALKALDDAVTTAEGACRVHADQLRQHMESRPAEDEESVVVRAQEELKLEQLRIEEVFDGANAVLISDQTRRQMNQRLVERIQQQEEKTVPWRRLNDLIGSADGAKFRMIAQRRTLDVLLRYANHQLNILSARYRLDRLPESLNLIVVDRDMGDEQRSVHSLSGGESFLVSLSLALGLASLTSNRLRIESLFIDEGFGSLDQETLQTAMSALMQLEAQGRKVGVISHVAEMADAIPVQIQVVKGRGGASRIVVPGAMPTEVSLSGLLSADSAVATPIKQLRQPESAEIKALASRLLAILQRELSLGTHRVSSRSLRTELGCDAKTFRDVQAALSGCVAIDGRSLRLTSKPSEGSP
jgi:exonuclease SbcC